MSRYYDSYSVNKDNINWITLRESASGWFWLDFEMIDEEDISIYFITAEHCISWLKKNSLKIYDFDDSVCNSKIFESVYRFNIPVNTCTIAIKYI